MIIGRDYCSNKRSNQKNSNELETNANKRLLDFLRQKWMIFSFGPIFCANEKTRKNSSRSREKKGQWESKSFFGKKTNKFLEKQKNFWKNKKYFYRNFNQKKNSLRIWNELKMINFIFGTCRWKMGREIAKSLKELMNVFIQLKKFFVWKFSV